MELYEGDRVVRGIVFQVAALAGLAVRPHVDEQFGKLVLEGGNKAMEEERRAEAVGNLLLLLGEALKAAQERHGKRDQPALDEECVAVAKKKLCPIYPFD